MAYNTEENTIKCRKYMENKSQLKITLDPDVRLEFQEMAKRNNMNVTQYLIKLVAEDYNKSLETDNFEQQKMKRLEAYYEYFNQKQNP